MISFPRVGVHPDDVITMLRYAPLATTHLTWRNTVLEGWHEEGRIHDPDMFRANADTSLIFQQALWNAFGEQIGSGDLVSLEDVAGADNLEAFQNALYNAYDDAFGGERTLPNGMTLAELAQGELSVLQDHAISQIDALAAKAEQPGVDVVLLFLAMRGGGSCGRWWGSPRWLGIVDAFVALLADPANDWWQQPPQLSDGTAGGGAGSAPAAPSAAGPAVPAQLRSGRLLPRKRHRTRPPRRAAVLIVRRGHRADIESESAMHSIREFAGRVSPSGSRWASSAATNEFPSGPVDVIVGGDLYSR